MVTFSKLISLATKKEKCLLVTGWVFTSLTGCVLPSFIWFFGDVFDSFDPDVDPLETRDRIRQIFYIMIGLSVFGVITSTLQYATLAAASSQIAARFKQKYLEAILRQESAWFDMINYTELSARLTKECQAIQRAIGEKYGQIIFSLSMSLSGLALGFAKGWSLTLIMCGIGPIFIFGTYIFSYAI